MPANGIGQQLSRDVRISKFIRLSVPLLQKVTYTSKGVVDASAYSIFSVDRLAQILCKFLFELSGIMQQSREKSGFAQANRQQGLCRNFSGISAVRLYRLLPAIRRNVS